MTARFQRGLEPGRKGLALLQAESGGQTVAQRHDFDGPRGGWGSEAQPCECDGADDRGQTARPLRRSPGFPIYGRTAAVPPE
jgi:hypothetical protein